MSKGKRPTQNRPDFEFKGFISLPLSAESKNQFRGWYGEGLDKEVDLGAILAGGYKLSASFYAGNGNFSASLTCVNPGDPNFGYALSAFGPDVSTALALVLYKHEVLASGNWKEAIGAVDKSSDIG